MSIAISDPDSFQFLKNKVKAIFLHVQLLLQKC